MRQYKQGQYERSDAFDKGLRISAVFLFLWIGVVALVSFSVGIDGNNGVFIAIAGAFVIWGVSYHQGAITALGKAKRDFATLESQVARLLAQGDAKQ